MSDDILFNPLADEDKVIDKKTNTIKEDYSMEAIKKHPLFPLFSGNPFKQQIDGDHYVKYEIQPVELIDKLNLDYLRSNALRHVIRYYEYKDFEDLKKAFHYCRMAEKQDCERLFETNKFIEQFDDLTIRIIIRLLLRPSMGNSLAAGEIADLLVKVYNEQKEKKND